MELHFLLSKRRTLQKLLKSREDLLELLLNNPSFDKENDIEYLYVMKNRYINELIEIGHKIDGCCKHDWVDDYIENVYNSSLQQIKYCSICEKNYEDIYNGKKILPRIGEKE